jgi:hypothetical protein
MRETNANANGETEEGLGGQAGGGRNRSWSRSGIGELDQCQGLGVGEAEEIPSRTWGDTC